MIDEQKEKTVYELPAVKLERMVTDERLRAALENLCQHANKSVMAARMVVKLKCGANVSAADASALRVTGPSFQMIIVPRKPKTQRDLDLMREHLSEYLIEEQMGSVEE
jgi:hypothetical protein